MSSRALRRYEASSSGVPTTAVSAIIAEQVAEAHSWSTSETTDRWRERGLLHSDGSLTIAGALTLTNPDETLGAAKFTIDIRSYEADESTSYVRREAMKGPVQTQAETRRTGSCVTSERRWLSPGLAGTT